MIVDLNQILYVVDNNTHEHKVSTIDIINKISDLTLSMKKNTRNCFN